jgi:hypothetical protein
VKDKRNHNVARLCLCANSSLDLEVSASMMDAERGFIYQEMLM